MTPNEFWMTVWLGGALVGGGVGLTLGGLWVVWDREPGKRWTTVAGLAVCLGAAVAMIGIGG